MLAASIAKSTKAAYKSAYDKYSTFIGRDRDIIPISMSDLSKFIAHMHLNSYKANSIRSTVAGLGYFHTMSSFPDPSKHIIIKSLLKGSSKLSDSPDIRLPVSRDILKHALQVVDQVAHSPYSCILYSAMLTLAFHALLRIGEYTVHGKYSTHTLKLRHVKLIYNLSTLKELQLTIPHFKHSDRPVTLSIPINVQSNYCTVRLMNRYLLARKNLTSDFLFVHQNGSPVSAASFSRVFRNCMVKIGLNPAVYKPHSLRIGGATLAHELNYSDSQIEALGRWHSQSYKRYIRVPMISTLV